MFGFIKKLFGSTPVETKTEAPYKVEVPAPVAEVKPVVAEGSKTNNVKPSAPAKVKPSAPKAPAKKAAPQKAAAGKKSGRKPKAK
jgi:hypothetical protein